ncbi:MAG: amino acid-binding protein [Prevotellaceae bacterium]|nr:amino acid-binding protein [Candidatus Colivivens caballi]
MTIQQLSVFVENKSGAMLHILNLLKAEGIQLLAVNIADTVEYGIFRIICSEPSKAYNVLKDAKVSVTLTDVFAIELDDEVGELANVLEIFNKEGISITYLYSFLLNGKGIMIFRTIDNERTREVINLNHLKFITEPNLYTLV